MGEFFLGTEEVVGSIPTGSFMYTIDEEMIIGEEYCSRCGMNKGYHNKKIMKENTLPCIRKKPYKLKDGVEVRLGMQVWHYWPYSNEDEIITGMVRFIRKWGGLTLWKYPEQRAPEKFHFEDKTIVLPGRPAHEGTFTASDSCFSSLENAEVFRRCKRSGY